MVALTPKQEQNLRAALEVAPNDAMRVRLAFAIWTESRALIYANSGQGYREPSEGHTSWNWDPKRNQPIGTPESRAAIRGVLRRSLLLPHDVIGSNGRSTGMLQQLSAETGGTWGPMVGTMDPIHSAKLFLTHLRVTDDPVFVGTLQTPSGPERVKVELSDPIAADVLRVQQPLADEARSSNYDATQVATARAIVAQLFPGPQTAAGDILEDLTMADRGVILIVKGDGGMWITWPLAGLKQRLDNVDVKNAFVNTLRRNNVPVVEDLANEEGAYLAQLVNIKLVADSIIGGYQSPDAGHRNNVAGIWYRTDQLARAAGINTDGL